MNNVISVDRIGEADKIGEGDKQHRKWASCVGQILFEKGLNFECIEVH